ncbi:MAG: OsmC family protein [Candidatus Limnocylindrales bacterium]
MKTVTVSWQPEADRFEAHGGHRDQRIRVNAPHEGPATGFSPAELLLAGAGACSAWDVVEILRKQHQPLTSLTVSVEGHQHEGPPHQFERVELIFRATGHGLDASKVQRAVALSEERYCSVVASLRGAVQVSCRVEVAEAAA